MDDDVFMFLKLNYKPQIHMPFNLEICNPNMYILC